MEVKSVSAATSTQTIEHLRTVIATHGLPEMLVTDNGSIFTSSEFTKRNGIRCVTSASYHPA
jgi:transposase InsO family protein